MYVLLDRDLADLYCLTPKTISLSLRLRIHLKWSQYSKRIGVHALIVSYPIKTTVSCKFQRLSWVVVIVLVCNIYLIGT
jgi:hypothetical protein